MPGRPYRYTRCCLCGVWRSKGEMQVHMVVQALQQPFYHFRRWTCPAHSAGQVQRSRKRSLKRLAWLLNGGD